MLSVYSPIVSPRLRSALELVFEDILKVPFTLCTERSSLDTQQPCLNYSKEEMPGSPYIRPHKLLFEKGIRPIEERLNSDGILFPTASNISDQDVLAACFFFLSRYEEYWPGPKDKHGRYMASRSQMHQAGLLEKPLVDLWAQQLYSALCEQYPTLPKPNLSYKTLATFDIDVAYAYKGRSRFRRLKASLKDLIRGEHERIRYRKAVLSGEVNDPYDSYEYQRSTCSSSHIDTRHFFLLGDYGPLDKNLSHEEPIMRNLIQEIRTWSNVGVHPSMRSNQSEKILQEEVARLTAITAHPVKRSRQHFLFLNLPSSYQSLIAAGITEDYSMGYADHVGFRAGTAQAYRWYDLSQEKNTQLYVHTIIAMDSTLRDYMKLSPEEAIARLRSLKQSVIDVQGTFCMLWHNHTIANQLDWQGWQTVYETGLEKP